MRTILNLELKPLEKNDPDTVRIYNLTNDSVVRLNNYIDDFLQTISILTDNKARYSEEKEQGKVSETEESIAFVEKTIQEVFDTMRYIVSDMPDYVALKEIEIT